MWWLHGGMLLLLLAQQAAPLVQSVDLVVPVAPVYFRQNGAQQLVYELHITNFQQVDIAIAAVTLRDQNGSVLATYADAELRQRLTRPGLRNDQATPEVVGPGQRAVLNVWLPVPLALLVTHTVDLDVRHSAGTVRTRAVGGATAAVLKSMAEIDPPLRGGPWIAIYDPLLKGGHRTAFYTLNGRARIPGRYAIDFIALPQSGALPPTPAPDGNGFGAEVLAVADGTVTIAVDGVSDATPKPIALEQAAGNHVAIDIGGGRFAFYEHLQMGSVAVKVGDRVKSGQVIARLGSSGSSSIGPHLHFHVSDASATLAAEGVPFVFRRFTDIGRFASLSALLAGEQWLPEGAVRTTTLERPDPMVVVHFP